MTPRPTPMALAQEPTEPSVTWTRPPKPNKRTVLHGIATQLGTLLPDRNSNNVMMTAI